MNKKLKICSVSFFDVNFKDQLVTIEKEINCKLYIELKESKIFTCNLQLYNISINKDSIIWFNYLLENPIGFFADIDLNVQKNKFTIQFIRDNFIFSFENKKAKKLKLSGELCWEINDSFFIYLFTIEKLYYVKNKNSLNTLNQLTGETLWHYTLTENEFDWHYEEYDGQITIKKAEILRIIGVYEDIVWVVLNSGFLLGIDTEKGVLLHIVSQIKNYHGSAPIYPKRTHVAQESYGKAFNKRMQLDEEKGVLFGLSGLYYFEIDLKKPSESYEVYDTSETMTKNKIEADMSGSGYEWPWHKDEIYFGKNFSDGNNLGVFNRTTKQVTWATRVINQNGVVESFKKIECSENRMYALTQKTNTLYVFEKPN